ncbi:MAG: hypothetical protein ACW98K_00160 [Candidatus Kariarchaeaceae archaeon]
MEGETQHSIICPECRAVTSVSFTNRPDYQIKALPLNSLSDEFHDASKVVLSEFHENHICVVSMDKKIVRDQIVISDEVTPALTRHIKSLTNKIFENRINISGFHVLILSKTPEWRLCLNYLFSSLFTADKRMENQSELISSQMRTDVNFGKFAVKLNNNQFRENSKFNVIISDQESLQEYNVNQDVLGKMLFENGKFIVTVNSKKEDPVPYIAMSEYNEVIAKNKLNFAFVDVNSIEQTGMLLNQIVPNK